MRDKFGIVKLRDPLQILGKLTVQRYKQMFYVVVHPPRPVNCCSGAPEQPIEQVIQKRGSINCQTLHDVGVTHEELVHAIIVVVTIRPKTQNIPDDGAGRVQASTHERPGEWRYVLCSHLHEEHPMRSLAARSRLQCLVDRRERVVVDSLHDNRGALEDRPHQTLPDQNDGVSEAFDCVFIFARTLDEINASRREERHVLSRYRVSNVAQAESGHVVNHARWIPEDVHGHDENLVRDNVQIRIALFEEILPFLHLLAS